MTWRLSGAPMRWVQVGLYPTLLGAVLACYAAASWWGWPLRTTFAWMAGVRLAFLFFAEWRWPAKREWRMSWASFKRDLMYIAVNGSLVGSLKWLGVWWAIGQAVSYRGVMHDWPIVLQVVVLVLAFEFPQYWFHRLSHEGRGRVGAWLWRMHVAHHLPDRVYLLMHAVGHPINLFISLLITQLPAWLLGASPDAVFLFGALLGLQGLVSHFNVDLKAGPFNYLLVGAELHRFHHSASMDDAQNYGVLTPFWDLVFGTFRYDPVRLPERLGVEQPADYPASTALWQVLALPFRRSVSGGG